MKHTKVIVAVLLALCSFSALYAQKPTLESLVAAIEAHDEAELRALIAQGANVNAANDFGTTPLLTAAQANNADAIAILVKAGAKLERKDSMGTTALIQAAASGSSDALRALIAAGANVNAKQDTGATAIVFAESVEIAQLLINAGANLKAKDADGETMLERAIGLAEYRGDEELTEYLRSARKKKR